MKWFAIVFGVVLGLFLLSRAFNWLARRWAFWYLARHQSAESVPVTYTALQLASIEARWDDVLRLADQLESQAAESGRAGVLRTSLPSARARALHKLGRTSEAFALLDRQPQSGQCTAAEHARMTGQLLYLTGDLNESTRQFEQALILKPNDLYTLLGLAEAYAAHTPDAVKARRCLEAAKAVKPDLEAAEPIFRSAEGMVLFAEGDYQSARTMLEQGIQRAQQHLEKTPLARASVCKTRAVLAATCFRLGDSPAALEHAQAVMPFAVTHQDPVMLALCREAGAEIGVQSVPAN